MKINETKLSKEQAYTMALNMQKEIDGINAQQYIGMPREERKDIIIIVLHKTNQLRVFCYENGIDWQEIVFVARSLA